MGMLRVVAAGALVAWSALAASIVPGDARRGEQLFKSEQCVLCHSFKGVGGTAAPDLATPHRPRLYAGRHGQPDVEPRSRYVGGHEEARHREGRAVSGIGGRPVRLLRLGALLRKARRCGPRQAGVHRQTLRRVPWHRHVQRRGRAARGQVGVPGRPGGAGAADVEPRRPYARGVRREEAGLAANLRAGAHRYAGVPAKPARDRATWQPTSRFRLRIPARRSSNPRAAPAAIPASWRWKASCATRP